MLKTNFLKKEKQKKKLKRKNNKEGKCWEKEIKRRKRRELYNHC